jgi:hypothetical protein
VIRAGDVNVSLQVKTSDPAPILALFCDVHSYPPHQPDHTKTDAFLTGIGRMGRI